MGLGLNIQILTKLANIYSAENIQVKLLHHRKQTFTQKNKLPLHTIYYEREVIDTSGCKKQIVSNVKPYASVLNPLPDNKISDWFKPKQIADDILKCI